MPDCIMLQKGIRHKVHGVVKLRHKPRTSLVNDNLATVANDNVSAYARLHHVCQYADTYSIQA